MVNVVFDACHGLHWHIRFPLLCNVGGFGSGDAAVIHVLKVCIPCPSVSFSRNVLMGWADLLRGAVSDLDNSFLITRKTINAHAFSRSTINDREIVRTIAVP